MKHFLLISLLGVFLLSLSSCYKEKFETSGDAQLRFSRDTMVFDTVFTTQGSATRILKIYNDADLPIIIDKIQLQEQNGVHFRFNFDGISGTEITNVEVPKNDSIYIFGEVTIDPDAPLTSSPFIVEGTLNFETNGNNQSVVLNAYGQNANYIPLNYTKGGQYYYSCDLGDWNWDDPEGKPYIINGVIFIDSCNVNIPAGTNVYVHGGIINSTDGSYNDGLLFMLPKAELHLNGTLENPVTFQTDRLEHNFDDISGQWSGIRLGAGCQNNTFDHAIIKNSIVGVRVDSAAQLTINNSEFAHTTSNGVLGIHAEIDINNSLIYDTGDFGFRGIYGGEYNLNYVTISADGNQSGSINLTNGLCVDEFCQNYISNKLTTKIKNCIFHGNQRDAMSMVNFTSNTFDFEYNIKSTITKVTDLTEDPNFSDFFNNCSDCINFESDFVLFKDISNYDFHLDTLSIAETNGLPLIEFPTDLEGNMRSNSTPDIGCYEYQY